MSNLTDRLAEILEKLEATWSPFARPSEDWTTDGGLQMLLDTRDRALAQAAPLLDDMKELWKSWEADAPKEQERARVFSIRNRLVNLALEASRFQTGLENGVRRRIDEGRRKAADSDRKMRAARAYGSMSLR
ncbi:MAG: hypothetical protein H6686_10605 [Fibrobacteria bacterium]|nr:hypothetical protein [Fibrobacteria bacterium]